MLMPHLFGYNGQLFGQFGASVLNWPNIPSILQSWSNHHFVELAFKLMWHLITQDSESEPPFHPPCTNTMSDIIINLLITLDNRPKILETFFVLIASVSGLTSTRDSCVTSVNLESLALQVFSFGIGNFLKGSMYKNLTGYGFFVKVILSFVLMKGYLISC